MSAAAPDPNHGGAPAPGGSIRIVLCASPTGLPYTDAIDVDDLARLAFVGAPQSVTFSRMLGRQLRAHGISSLNTVIRLGHAEPIKNAVADNGWVSLVPAYCAIRDVAAGRLRVVDVRGLQLTEGIGLLTREAGYLTPLAGLTIEEIRRHGRTRKLLSR